jgi:catechol 2,3-dioxygenase-like lactoylglutathione lyase family enzyme
MHLDHITIRTEQLEQTRDFLLKVFDGLREGTRPSPIAETIPGYWLYAGDAPLIHLIGSGPPYDRGPSRAREAYDHAGIFMKNYEAFLAKLHALHIPHSLMNLPELNERRIFIQTPTGILLETVFRE